MTSGSRGGGAEARGGAGQRQQSAMASGACQGTEWILVVQTRLLAATTVKAVQAQVTLQGDCWQGDMAGCRPAQRRREGGGHTLDAERRAAEEELQEVLTGWQG